MSTKDTEKKFQVDVLSNSKTLGEKAAQFVAKKIQSVVKRKGKVRVIFATGASQLNFIESLIRIEEIPWHKAECFHLDEYVGLDSNHTASFRLYLKKRLFERLSPSPQAVHYLNPSDIETYSNLLEKEEIDLACIGIGENGHIAFNDPHVADFKDSKSVKIVQLDRKCREQQVGEGWFESLEKTPRHAATLTIPQIMSAQTISCVVPDKRKAWAVQQMLVKFKNKPNTECPASILQIHQDCTLFLDQSSASLVPELSTSYRHE